MDAKGKFQVFVNIDNTGFVPVYGDLDYPNFPVNGLFLNEQAAIRYVDDFRYKDMYKRTLPIRIVEIKHEFEPVGRGH